MKKQLLVTLIAACLLGVQAMADVPNLINYQGRLRDNQGLPFNGTVSVQISLYTNETGGTFVLSQNIGSVPITNGVYSFSFGSAALPSLLSNPEVWLQVTAAGNILSPRQRLIAVPYAVVAGTVQGQALNVDLASGRVDIAGDQKVKGSLTVSNGIQGAGVGVVTYVDVRITNSSPWVFSSGAKGYRIVEPPEWTAGSKLELLTRVLSVNMKGEYGNNSISCGGRFWLQRNGVSYYWFIFDSEGFENTTFLPDGHLDFRIWYVNCNVP